MAPAINTVLIAGAGYIGQRAARHLQAAGITPVLLRKSAPERSISFPQVQANLLTPSRWSDVIPEVDAVLFCAAARRSEPESYKSLFQNSQNNLIQFLLDRGDPLQRYIMMSTTGVYGDTNGAWVDEDTAPQPSNPNAKDILDGETLVLNTFEPSTVVRFSGLYGPGRTRLIRAVKRGEAYIQPGDPVYLNHIHAEDAARSLVHLLNIPNPESIYLASDAEPTPRGVVLQWIANQLHKPGPIEDMEKAPTPRHGNKRISSQRLQASGFDFQYPNYREGYRSLLASE